MIDQRELATMLDPKALDTVADVIMHRDGDRDHMSQSDLTCEQTQAIARFLRALSREFSSGKTLKL